MKRELFRNQVIENPQFIRGGNGDDPINDAVSGAKKKKKSFWQWLKGIFTK